MPIASIIRIPDKDKDRPVAAGMRDTAGQDTIIETPRGWRHDRRVRYGAGGLLLILALLTIAWLLKGWSSSDVTVDRDRVRIATVTRGQFLSDVAAQATVVAAVSPTLYAPAAGTVTLVTAGATASGATMVRLTVTLTLGVAGSVSAST
jgi:HlyD family secretion protein